MPYECCVELGFGGSRYMGLIHVVLSDGVVLDRLRRAFLL